MKPISLIVILTFLINYLSTSQSYDISHNIQYHHLTNEIQFIDKNCQPDPQIKTIRNPLGIHNCKTPFKININLINSSSKKVENYLFLDAASHAAETRNDNSLIKISLPPYCDSIIGYTVTEIAGSNFQPILLSSEYVLFRTDIGLQNSNFTHQKKRICINNLTKGLFLSFLIFTLFFLIQLRTIEFLFYFLYQIANIFYFADSYWINEHVSLEWLAHESLRNLVKTISQPVIYIFYFRFLRSFLDTNNKFKSIDLWLRILEQSLILIVIVSLGAYFIHSNFYSSFQAISRLYMALIGIGTLIYFYCNRNTLVSFMLWGGGFLLLGSSLALLFSNYPNLLDGQAIYPLDFMIAGTIIEFFIFSFGLSYKMQRESRKFGQLQEKLNKQLLNNQLIREKKLNSLAEQLSLAENERKNMAVELKSLRSQLNPHFLFNSLNSLKKYILKNDITNASLYIDKFASLIRKMLSSSRKNLISLKDEIDSLSLYLELENERLGFELKWEIIVDESLDIEEVYIPPILIQPFAENAIWHGLINKTKGIKELSIHFEDKKPLKITIKDNGIGITAAKQLKSNSTKNNRKSLGTKMIQERIELIKKFYNVNASLKIIENPNRGGTEIQINIPELKE